MVIQRTEFVSLPLGHVGRLTKNNLAYLHPSVSTFQRSLSYWAGELQLRPSLHLQMRAWCSKVLWKAENQYSTKVLGLFEIISVKGFVQYIQFLFFWWFKGKSDCETTLQWQCFAIKMVVFCIPRILFREIWQLLADWLGACTWKSVSSHWQQRFWKLKWCQNQDHIFRHFLI
jgi:hypothetical protein